MDQTDLKDLKQIFRIQFSKLLKDISGLDHTTNVILNAIMTGNISNFSKAESGIAFLHNKRDQTQYTVKLITNQFDSFKEDSNGHWKPSGPFQFPPESLYNLISPNLHNFEFESKIKSLYKSQQRKYIKTKIIDFYEKNLYSNKQIDKLKEFKSSKLAIPYNDFEFQASDLDSENFETLALLVRSLHSSHTNNLKYLKKDLTELFQSQNTGIFDMNSVKDYKFCMSDIKTAVLNTPDVVFPVNALKNISSGQFVFKSFDLLYQFLKKFLFDLETSEQFQIYELHNGQVDPQESKDRLQEYKDINIVVCYKKFGLNLLFELRFQLEDVISIQKDMKLYNEVIEMSVQKFRLKQYQDIWQIILKRWSSDGCARWVWDRSNQVKTLFESGLDVRKFAEENLPEEQQGQQWEVQVEGDECKCGCSFYKKTSIHDTLVFRVYRQCNGTVRPFFSHAQNSSMDQIAHSFSETSKQMIKINEFKSFQFEDQELRVVKQKDGRVEVGFGLQIDTDFLWVGEVCKATEDSVEILRYELIQAGQEDVAKIVRVPNHYSFESLNYIKDEKQNLKIYIIDSFKQFDFDN